MGAACARLDDRDENGVPDKADDCPDTPNSDQTDTDGVGVGDTLVVETSHFNPKGDERVRNLVLSGSEHSHLVERFRRVDADTIDYRFTVTDPRTFSRPWTAEIPMAKLGGPLFEYACHEGNYGLYNILAGARAAEQAAIETASSR